MNWKREAEDKLRCYAKWQSALKRTGQELRRLELEMVQLRAVSTDGRPVQGGGNAREEALCNNIAMRQELEALRDATRRKVKEVEGALKELAPEEREVLELMVVHYQHGNAEKMAQRLHMSKPTVYRVRDKALRKFAMAFYGAIET